MDFPRYSGLDIPAFGQSEVWQALREAAGGSMYIGDVAFGNAVIP